ncbi:MAG TPA: hypothetical protein VF077_02980 [Nitrospiraceae bacterium]
MELVAEPTENGNGNGNKPNRKQPEWWPFVQVQILFFSGLAAFFIQLYRRDFDHPWFYVVVLAFVGIVSPDVVAQFLKRFK